MRDTSTTNYDVRKRASRQAGGRARGTSKGQHWRRSSTLDEVAHDERRDAIRVPSDRERETTINKPFLFLLILGLVVVPGYPAMVARRGCAGGGENRPVAEFAGGENGFLIRVKCDLAVFLVQSYAFVRYLEDRATYLPIIHS